METEGLFRYTLTDVVTRVVEGKYGFVVQVRPQANIVLFCFVLLHFYFI